MRISIDQSSKHRYLSQSLIFHPINRSTPPNPQHHFHQVLSTCPDQPCRSVSDNRISHKQKKRHSLEPPASNSRRATVETVADLRPETIKAVVVPQVETLVVVQVLDFEARGLPTPFGRRAHLLCLARREPASEHASVTFAGEPDPFLRLASV